MLAQPFDLLAWRQNHPRDRYRQGDMEARLHDVSKQREWPLRFSLRDHLAEWPEVRSPAQSLSLLSSSYQYEHPSARSRSRSIYHGSHEEWSSPIGKLGHWLTRLRQMSPPATERWARELGFDMKFIPHFLALLVVRLGGAWGCHKGGSYLAADPRNACN